MESYSAHWKRFLFFFSFFLFFFFSQKAFALENPHLYYDWNTYRVEDKVLGIQAFAQGTSSTQPVIGDYRDYEQHNYILGFTGNLAPDNPLYLFKKIEEGMATALTFNAETKERLRLEFAGERLTEMERLARLGNARAFSSVANDYRSTAAAIAQNLSALKSQGRNITALSQAVDLEGSKHMLVLEEVSLQVPPQAEQGIKTALSMSEQVVDTAADVLGKPAVPQEVVERLQAMKVLGVLSEEEVAKVIQTPSRKEAREELRKYVEARVFPEADFKKFDETARINFPQGYFTTLEIKKFKELKDLETQKPDEQTLQKVQEFAKTYKPGEIVPPEIRRWWVPLVRLEELQNTIRPDLIPADYLRNRPEDYQKYQEVVERIKPTKKDVAYVENLIKTNPNLLNDPAYARIKAIADKFGSHETAPQTAQAAQSCAGGSHWVAVPFMPGGGYCVPNYDFPTPVEGFKDQACPSGFHRNTPGGSCYPDKPKTDITSFRASGDCPAGYRWVPAPQTGGYCSPQTVTDGGGFPSPISGPGYCLPGYAFRDGKCERYNPPPAQGCPSGSWWNGSSCIQQKTCDSGYYQDHTGECKKGSETRICAEPPGGCGFNAFWDQSGCTCKSTFDPRPIGEPYPTPGTTGDAKTQCEKASGCSWTGSSCQCSGTGGTYQTPSYSTPGTYQTPSYEQKCGSGYYWNGSYCAQSSGGSYPTPSGTYGTPSYSYPSPSYTIPPQYGTPSYATPPYGTPSYETPPPYGTPEYSSPPPYGTPEYSTPPPYATPPQ